MYDNYFKEDDIHMIFIIAYHQLRRFFQARNPDKNKTQDRTRYEQNGTLLTGPAQRVSQCLPKLLSRIYDYWKAIVCSFTVREQTYVSLM